jgi:hypothetical protein
MFVYKGISSAIARVELHSDTVSSFIMQMVARVILSDIKEVKQSRYRPGVAQGVPGS